MTAVPGKLASVPQEPLPDSGSAVAVELDKVGVTYDSGTVALQDLSLTIRRGQTLGVVGPSGCGKSTLLQALAGLREPSSGSIRWSSLADSRHRLAMVFQTDTLLPWLTVERNVGLHFELKRSWNAEKREYVRSLLHMVGLGDFAKSFPYQLSGGMKRRVAFLAAVAPNPAVLLLDEPFSAVDEPTRVSIHQDVLRIVREFEMTVVLVTHDLAEAITLSDEIAILGPRPGRVVNIHPIPFGVDRDVLKLRQQEEYLRLYKTLWGELSDQIGRSSGMASR
jgi:ABC-type nitrate/sulfonate/bicarbonate transport system ATPase subunit